MDYDVNKIAIPLGTLVQRYRQIFKISARKTMNWDDSFAQPLLDEILQS